MSFAYGISRNYKEACDSLSSTRETIGEKYTRLAVLEKQITAYHSVIDNYGSLIKAFCVEEDKEKRKAKRKIIYRKGKNRTLETDGYEFVRNDTNPNQLILIQFYGFKRELFYQDKFDIEDDFKHNNAFSKEGYDYIKFKLEKKINHLSELEQEYSHYYPLYLAIHKGLYDKYNDVASIPYNCLYKMYDNRTEYATKVNFDLGIPQKGKEESLNREEVLGLIKTILSVTECCIKNGIPLSFHIDDEYHFRIIE